MQNKELYYNSSKIFQKVVEICHEQLGFSTLAKEYLLNRKISWETIKKYKIGVFPSDLRVLFSHVNPKALGAVGLVWNSYESPFKLYPIVVPIFDIYDNIIAIGCRTMLDEKKRKELGIPKYRNSIYRKGLNLFGLNIAKEHIRKNNSVFVVEGYFDQIMGYQCSVPNIVATCGTALTSKQVLLLSRYAKHIHLVFDNDEAGNLAIQKSFEKHTKDGIVLYKTCVPPEFKDMDEYLKAHGNNNMFKKLNYENQLCQKRLQ